MPSPETVTLIILGASGDLTRRLLLPGLGTLLAAEPERRVRLVGADLAEMSEDDWHARVRDAVGASECQGPRIEELVGDTAYVQADLLDPDQLIELLGRIDGPGVLYFALPPAVTAQVCARLADLEVPDNLRLGLEKPFGADLEGAQRLNAVLHDIVQEDQVFRVDHFLGQSAVLNLLGFRFANRMFEPLWNSTNIEQIDIVFDETLTVEGRAGYYDRAGALIDMLQSHLLLVMALVTMEEPSRIDARELRDLMTHALRAARLWQDDPEVASRRGRYTAGTIGDREVPNYADEPGVDPDRQTETLAEITVAIDNRRWVGVPIRLRSGKALGDRVRTITLHFRPVPHVPTGLIGPAAPNRLTIEMNPERLILDILTNGEGDAFTLEHTSMTADLGHSTLLPYGEILAGIIDGDPLLSVRSDTAEECWRIVTPVVQAWRDGRVPLEDYPAGSTGPADARG